MPVRWPTRPRYRWCMACPRPVSAWQSWRAAESLGNDMAPLALWRRRCIFIASVRLGASVAVPSMHPWHWSAALRIDYLEQGSASLMPRALIKMCWLHKCAGLLFFSRKKNKLTIVFHNLATNWCRLISSYIRVPYTSIAIITITRTIQIAVAYY